MTADRQALAIGIACTATAAGMLLWRAARRLPAVPHGCPQRREQPADDGLDLPDWCPGEGGRG